MLLYEGKNKSTPANRKPTQQAGGYAIMLSPCCASLPFPESFSYREHSKNSRSCFQFSAIHSMPHPHPTAHLPS